MITKETAEWAEFAALLNRKLHGELAIDTRTAGRAGKLLGQQAASLADEELAIVARVREVSPVKLYWVADALWSRRETLSDEHLALLLQYNARKLDAAQALIKRDVKSISILRQLIRFTGSYYREDLVRLVAAVTDTQEGIPDLLIDLLALGVSGSKRGSLVKRLESIALSREQWLRGIRSVGVVRSVMLARASEFMPLSREEVADLARVHPLKRFLGSLLRGGRWADPSLLGLLEWVIAIGRGFLPSGKCLSVAKPSDIVAEFDQRRL